MKKIFFSFLIILLISIYPSMLAYSNFQIAGDIPISSSLLSKWAHTLNSERGNPSAHEVLASIQLFNSNDPNDNKLGFDYLSNKYASGSYYAAGKLGWAYQRGLYVEPDMSKALELYHEAASHGMTYWQFLLAHAYEEGYFGLVQNDEMSQSWLHYEPRVHSGKYECWVASYYADGTFPANPQKQDHFQRICDGGL